MFPLLAFLTLAAVISCRPKPPEASVEVSATIDFAPGPPSVGETGLTVVLSDSDGNPLRLSELKVEGNMNHAGMRPSFADLKEEEPGQYIGTIEFTMGGDWFLLLSGELPDGAHFEKKIDVPGVRSSR